jgi:hypothetical protein
MSIDGGIRHVDNFSWMYHPEEIKASMVFAPSVTALKQYTLNSFGHLKKIFFFI